MPGLGRQALHERLLDALPDAEVIGSVADVPLVLKLPGIAMPLAFWIFTLTNPPGGRHPSEYKIQLMVPGQRRGERGDFVSSVEAFKLLVGVHPKEDIFVFWDAYKHREFAFSKNAQVKRPLLDAAVARGVASSERQLASGPEVIIAARGDSLHKAIQARIEN